MRVSELGNVLTEGTYVLPTWSGTMHLQGLEVFGAVFVIYV